jgi:hypothetical protein
MPYWIEELGWGGGLQPCGLECNTSFSLCLQHEPNNNNEEPIVWHEPILDEYWEQIEEEIARKKQLGIVTEIQSITIENVEIKKERVDALVYIFRSGRATNSSTFLQFINANLCEEGIISLSKLVDVSSELQTFCLCHNWIDSMDSARCLSMSLKSHSSINKLHLDHCDLGSNPEMLSVILQSEVKNIYLGSNNIDSVGSVTIAEYLEGNPPIDRIELDCNRLNDDDAILISQALKRNTNLSHLDLERNNFTSMGVKALLTCVFDGSDLNAISESNHTLERLVLFSNQKSYNLFDDKFLVDSIDRLIDFERTQKIMLALNDKDSLLKYLANVPLKLIPEVLGFPQQIVNQPQRKHLNIVYSIMRWWNMPMLYSYNCCVKSDTKRKRDN